MSGVIIQVAISVIVNQKNEVLISKRSADVHQANRWEFPGGKIESNESPELALSRELKEELGIDVVDSRFLTLLEYDYGDKKVCLHAFIVTKFFGLPLGLEGQPIQWVKISALQNYQFPDANLPIINLLQLPDVIQITGDFSSYDDLISKTQKCIDNGVTVLHFRAHDLNDVVYTQYAKALLLKCRGQNVKLILNRTKNIFDKVDADGLHMTRHEMKKYHERPCDTTKLFSVSCHEEEEITHAIKLSVDYCFLSPIKQAISHDAGFALGMELFSTLSDKYAVEIYALGGMQKADVNAIKAINGKGIASISENWK